MNFLDRICLILITLAMIYTSYIVHGAMGRLVSEHEANVKSYGIIAIKALDERNLAESHVAYLQKEIEKYHRNGWKEGKRK